MDSENPDDRPESPKKKIRPSSTTSENTQSSSTHPDHTPTTHGIIPTPQLNGLAPTRRGREAEASSSNDTNNVIPLVRSEEPASIQEEVVSSSEMVSSKQGAQQTYSEGDADSLTNEAEEFNRRETEDSVSLNDREAEIKEL